jgi:hypothetical protein
MPWRVSFFSQVQQARLGGWSENFWNTLSDLSAVTAAATLLRLRLLGVKGAPVQTPNIRISDIAHFREVTILNFPFTVYASPTTVTEVDFVTTAALLKLKAAPNYVTRQWLRGLFDEDTDGGGYFKPVPVDVIAYQTLFTLLADASQGWALRRLDRSTPKKYINAISVAGVVTCLGHGFVTDDYVRLSRVASPKLVNAIWRITKIDNDSFSLNGFPLQTVSPQITKSSIAQKQAYTFVQIANASVDRTTSHKTGRPFGQLSGRRRTRK